MSKNIAQVVVGLPVEGPFDYTVHPHLQENLQVGMRVLVSFNRQKRVAYVVKLLAKSAFENLNPILEVLENKPCLSEHALTLTRKMSEHYGCSWGEAIETYVPKVLRQKRVIALESLSGRNSSVAATSTLIQAVDFDDQYAAAHKVIQENLKQKQSVIVVVPEKEFKQQLAKKLEADFANHVVVSPDTYKVNNEVEVFQRLYSGEPLVFLGTRSAVFAPIPHIGSMILWDEENASYKQEQSPYYHARTVMQMRADIEGFSLHVVSAAPSTEMYKQAQSKSWVMENIQQKQSIETQVVDMKNYNPQKSWIVSFPLQNQIRKSLDEKKRILLFLNRRGFSLMTQCNECGHQMMCERCDIALTYMYSKNALVCRQCNEIQPVPKVCPKCKSKYLRSLGTGIEKIESDLARTYPDAYVALYDKETKKLPAKANLVIATQAIFRQRFTFQPDLVAALNIDSGLHQLDYKSSHNVFALLMRLYQMAHEKLVIQTQLPDMAHIQAVTSQQTKTFYQDDLKQRKDLSLPPFVHMIAIGVRGKKEEQVIKISDALFESFVQQNEKQITIEDPRPDGIAKLRDQYRYTIIMKSKSLSSAHAVIQRSLKEVKRRGVIVTVTVDP